MAVSLATVSSSAVKKVVDVTATADADTTATIPHGMASAPKEVSLLPLLAAAYTSAWTAAIDSTNVTLTKGTGGGSGNASAQLRVIIALPHSIVS